MRKSPSPLSLNKIFGIPNLSMREWRGGLPRSGLCHFDDKEHSQFPHVVKFSGGRSSGLMLLILLKNNLLNTERGDVVVFSNTSAEHPATYDFVCKMKQVTESYGIPFFITEWQTFETVIRGEWTRKPTYRLVNELPLSTKNPNGYCHRGEVFEEMVAWGGMLPSVHTRVCTTQMKMFVTREFLSDWLALRKQLPLQGHSAKLPQTSPEELYKIHRLNHGTMSMEEIQVRWETMSNRHTFRPQQNMQDFTKAPLPNKVNKSVSGSVFGERCFLFGNNSAPFLTFLGFRADEDMRYQKMNLRNLGGKTPGHDTHPPGEYSYAPLFSLGIKQKKVFSFWENQINSLKPYLPTDFNLSNCVYCFLKGSNTLSAIGIKKQAFERNLPEPIQIECRKRNTPNSLKWWAGLEKKYQRQAKKISSDGGTQSFGMFGLGGMNYSLIKSNVGRKGRNKAIARNGNRESHTLSCECTD